MEFLLAGSLVQRPVGSLVQLQMGWSSLWAMAVDVCKGS